MSIKFKSGRQELPTAILNINFADVAGLSAVSQDAISVPANAIVTGGEITVTTAWNTTGAATLSLGDAASATRYLNAVNLKAAARTALTLTGFKHTVEEFLKAVATLADAAATQGDARIVLTYAVEGRSAFNQGLDYRGDGIRGA